MNGIAPKGSLHSCCIGVVARFLQQAGKSQTAEPVREAALWRTSGPSMQALAMLVAERRYAICSPVGSATARG